VAPPCPEELVGSLAALPLPDAGPASAGGDGELDPLQEALYAEHRIEVPVIPWPSPPRRLLRISAQLYNTIDEYARLAAALQRLIGRT
jgi:isopenicillin-N epimerase